MDALELLKHDHRMVEQLLRDYGAAASAEQRAGVAEILVRELSKHAAVEELTVYPLARKVLPDGAEEIDRHLAGHMGVKKTLLALDRLPDKSGDRAGLLVAELRQEIEEHVREEEEVLMPRLREALGQQALDELGREVDRAKRTAPTRPHPHAPDRPPALAAAAPVAAIYDRLRDRLQRRTRT